MLRTRSQRLSARRASAQARTAVLISPSGRTMICHPFHVSVSWYSGTCSCAGRPYQCVIEQQDESGGQLASHSFGHVADLLELLLIKSTIVAHGMTGETDRYEVMLGHPEVNKSPCELRPAKVIIRADHCNYRQVVVNLPQFADTTDRARVPGASIGVVNVGKSVETHANPGQRGGLDSLQDPAAHVVQFVISCRLANWLRPSSLASSPTPAKVWVRRR